MDLSNLSPAPGSRKARKRLGRGTGSGLGKTSGRGHKGKGARSGGNTHPRFEGGQMPLQRRLPKRGFHNPFRRVVSIVNLGRLEAVFEAGAVVDVATLVERGLARAGQAVKVLAQGELTKALTVKAHAFSEAAKARISAAGGSAEVIAAKGKAEVGEVLEGFANAGRIPELRRRLLFTFAMLAVYRAVVVIPTPGIDGTALGEFFAQMQDVFGWVNLLSGGALEQFSIAALGIMPYISASIILQLMTVVIPHLERLSKEGEVGRRKITQYTRYGTVVLAVVQGLFISIGLEKLQAPGGAAVVYQPGWSFRVMTVITLAAGTAFLMWLGEQISERGIGNGISMLIFAGIVARLPRAVTTTVQFVREGEMSILTLLAIAALMVLIVGVIIFVERGQRRIPVQYAKRVVGRRMYGGQSSHLPLKLNTAGVIPPIFASSLLVFPATIAQFVQHPWAQAAGHWLSAGEGLYNVLFVLLIIFFSYFYTAVTFNTSDVAENMKKFGGFIPGIRPGQRTAEYIDRVLSRITLAGALYVATVCILPTILVRQFNVPFYFGGTALLIVVGVALDTVAQIETHLLTRSYQGFMRRGRLRGRRTS